MWKIRNPDEPDRVLTLQRHQLDFATSPAFATGGFGGWGSGKTTSGLGFIGISAWKSPPRTLGIALLPNYPMMKEWLEETLLPSFRDIIRGHNKDRRVIYLPGGRKLLYRSGHIPQMIQMSNVTYVYLDEPHLMKRAIWSHVVARARKKEVRLRIGLASLPKIGWLSEHFDGRSDLEYRAMHFSTYQNRHNHEDYIRNLRASCPASMEPAYLHGKFVPIGGMVYPEFDQAIHVLKGWKFGDVKMKNGGYTKPVINLSIDWGVRRPHVLWIQRVPKGAVLPSGLTTTREISIVVDEIYPDGVKKGLTIRALCRLIRKRCPPGSKEPWPYREVVADPAGASREATSGETEVLQARRYLEVPVLYNYGERIRVGIDHVKLAFEPLDGHPFLFFSDYLNHNPDPVMGYGSAKDNRHRAVVNAVVGYSYKEPTEDRIPDEPYHDEMFSHACDTIRYHVRHYYPDERIPLMWKG